MGEGPRGLEAYASGAASFAPGLRPQEAVAMPLPDVLGILAARHGDAVAVALSDEAVDLDAPLHDLPAAVRSPLFTHRDATWLKRTNMVGVNVRTVDDYAGVIKYALTLPAAYDSIHLLPIWEPGVVRSLYGIASWNLNTEFFSDELYAYAPNLDTIERQLRATVNLLHVMGRAVGMDVIPHTDRYAEPALATPDLYEWMRIDGRRIVDHSDGVVRDVERAIFSWLSASGPATPHAQLPQDAFAFFALDEPTKLAMLFGPPSDLSGRIDRRIGLVQHLHGRGLGPVPATMGVPFRGIEIDQDPGTIVVDQYGMAWPDFVMSHPQAESRVFSPLARFKLYERVLDNEHWEIDFDRRRDDVWDYVCAHYAHARHIGNFDFMRGDMSHVQMRPDGVPASVDHRYDILGAVKTHIRVTAGAPWFGYFAESFLPPRDVFQYGEEMDHLEASLADATLGDLQSTVVGSPQFLSRFRRYLDELATRTTAPAFTVMTADKDDPRFDGFYLSGNEARAFTSLFLTDMPSYTALGFEIRDLHTEPVENERYSKLFVFHERGTSNVFPSKARFGDAFVWGDNQALFDRLTALRRFAEEELGALAGSTTEWLIPPDAEGDRVVVAWTQEPSTVPAGSDQLVCVVNYSPDAGSGYFGIPSLPAESTLDPIYSTLGEGHLGGPVRHNGFFHRIEGLGPGEARAYLLTPHDRTGDSPTA